MPTKHIHDGKIQQITTFKHRLINDGMIPFDVKSVLDVGCERGLTGALLQRSRDLDRMAGLDIFEPYLDDVRKHGYYTDVSQFDLNSGQPFPFKDDSFDCALCIDVFEHLKDKETGFHVAREMERVAKRVVIAMPSCLMTHPDFDDNPHQRHTIIFKPSEFKRLGYRVIGVGPVLLHLAGKYVCLPIESWPISTAFPSLSLTFVCIKDGALMPTKEGKPDEKKEEAKPAPKEDTSKAEAKKVLAKKSEAPGKPEEKKPEAHRAQKPKPKAGLEEKHAEVEKA